MAALFIVQEIVEQRKPGGLLPVRFGRKEGNVHSIVKALCHKHHIEWFTITVAQERAINQYMKFSEGTTAGQWFIVGGAKKVLVPIGVRGGLFTREITPIGIMGSSITFPRGLRDTNWDDLDPAARVTPGNTVPGHCMSLPTAPGCMGIDAGTAPISKLGEECSREAEEVTMKVEQGLLILRNLEEQGDNLPANFDSLDEQGLIKLILRQHFNDRKRKDQVDLMIEHAHHSDRQRAQGWQKLFMQIDSREAENNRPDPSTPASRDHPNELSRLEPHVQTFSPPESNPRVQHPMPVLWSSGLQYQPSLLPSTQPLASFTSRDQPASSPSRPGLPTSSSSGSMRHTKRSGWESVCQRIGWRGVRGPGEEAQAFIAPTAPRPRHVGLPRNLPPVAAQPQPGCHMSSCYGNETSWNHSGSGSGSSCRRRWSRSGDNAYGRPLKTPRMDSRSPN